MPSPCIVWGGASNEERGSQFQALALELKGNKQYTATQLLVHISGDQGHPKASQGIP